MPNGTPSGGRLSPEAVLNNYLIENFEAYLWRDEGQGGTLWNFAQTDATIATVWNDVMERIPAERLTRYDTYYKSIVAELSSADETKETKQMVLAQILEAHDYVRRLPPPEGFAHGRSETPVMQSALPPQVADTKVPADPNIFKIEKFEAYLWSKESPGGTLRNLANTHHLKSVWNSVWKRIPPNHRAHYDSYYRELVAELSRSARWDRKKKTKQQLLAHVREAHGFVEKLTQPEASTRGRAESRGVNRALAPQVAAPKVTAVPSPAAAAETAGMTAPPVVAPKATAVPSPAAAVETAGMTAPPVAVPKVTAVPSPAAAAETAGMPAPPVAAPKVTAVPSPVIQNEETKSPASTKPKARAETPSKSAEKALNNLQMKKFEEFLWGADSHVGTLQSLALTDNKIKSVWDEAVQQIPPGLKERYASYYSMLVFGLSRSAWWECFTGIKKTKQLILEKVGEANVCVEGLAHNPTTGASPKLTPHGDEQIAR